MTDDSAGSNPLDDGLAAGFGRSAPDEDMVAESIVARLARERSIRTGVSLPLEGNPVPEPVLRPLGAARSELPKATGKYQLQGELARGGVGVVLRGHDVDLGRDVAMKVLHKKHLENPDLLQRFIEEAQIGGQLQHPGIVPVYDLGLTDDRPFFTMKLIKGQTLAHLLAEGERDPHALLKVFESVCQTMAYAHSRGVIHRDLKPANIMVGAFGEVQVVDWGMGKVLFAGGTADEVRAQSRHVEVSDVSVIETVRSQPGSVGTDSVVGSVMGTPAYMPPEQANGDVDRMDERSDVFALGAILCEILTGAPPYAGAAVDLIAMAARAELGPCHERLARSDVAPELRAIVEDCLRPARDSRPRNAEVLADRISGYLASVQERERTAKIEAAEQRVAAASARRAQRLTFGLAVAVLVCLVSIGGGWWWIDRAARQRQAEAEQRVATLMADARAAFGEAKGVGSRDLEPWRRAQVAIDVLVKECERVYLSEAQRSVVSTLQAGFAEEREAVGRQVERARRDERMLERLASLRTPPGDISVSTLWFSHESRRLDREYGKAFREYLEVEDLSVRSDDQLVRELARGRIELDLVAALDHWSLVRVRLAQDLSEEDRTVTTRIRGLASRLDDDPWRGKVRALIGDPRASRADLEEIASQTELSRLSALSFMILGGALFEAGAKDRAVELFHIGRLHHPKDFGLCVRLAMGLNMTGAEVDARLRAWEHAHALRPEFDGPLHHLGGEYGSAGRIHDQMRTYAILVDRDPKNGHWAFHYAHSLAQLGRLDEAVRVIRTAKESDPRRSHFLYQSLGDLLSLQGRHGEALAEYLDGHKRVPDVFKRHHIVRELLHLGRLPEALEWSRRHLEATIRQRKLGYLSPRYQRDAERQLAELEAIPDTEAILRGEREPKSLEEEMWAARLAFRRGDNAAAAERYRGLFGEQAEVGDWSDDVYRAVRAAARLSSRAGAAEWRALALQWMSALFDRARGADPEQRSWAIEEMTRWEYAPDLAIFRDGAKGLPAAERQAWTRLFQGVANTLELFRQDPPLTRSKGR
jgi:serine/threonine-protein kinase